MTKIMLVCNAGMSTTMLAKRMNEASDEFEVFACGESEYLDRLEGVELILVGPQVRYLIPTIKNNVNVPVEGINPMKYGILDGKGVVKDAQIILGGK